MGIIPWNSELEYTDEAMGEVYWMKMKYMDQQSQLRSANVIVYLTS